MLLCLGYPSSDVVKALPVAEIEDEDDSLWAFVVGWCDSFELLLSRCVPHLKFNETTCLLDGSDLEVDSYGGEEGLVEDLVCEAKKQARLADWGVANE